MKEKQNALAKRKIEKRGKSSLLQKILAHKVLILIIVAIFVVGSVVAFFVFDRKSSDNGYNNYLAMTQIRLYADKTSFYIGDEATSNFSVVIPSELSGEKLDIYNQSGEKVYSMDAKDMTLDKNGDLTCSIPMQINTETDGMQTFTAVAGQYFSSELSVFVTPHITLEQVMKSYEVGADVSAYLEKEYADEEDAEKVAKAAEKFLKKDERVGEVAVHGTDVYYSTVDMVAGMIKCAPQDPDMLGSGSSTEQKQKTAVSGYVPPVGSATVGNGVSARQTSFCEDSNIISAYNEPNGAIVKNNLIDSGNTGTNGNVLILRPATNALPVLPANNKLKSGAERINKTTEGTIVEEKKDDDAVSAILTRDLANYGTIILHGHGGCLPDENENISSTLFLLYRCYLEQTDDLIEDMPKQLYNKMLEYAAIDYQTKTGRAPKAEQLEDFCGNFYGTIGNISQWKIFSSWRPVIKITVEDKQIKKREKNQCDILMTSSFIMDHYNDIMFDNAIIYFGSCDALFCEQFNIWLINHGFKLVFGYEGTVQNITSLYNLKDVIDELTKTNKTQKWRTNTPIEACKSTENRLTNLFENIVQNAIWRDIVSVLYNDDTTMLFWGNPEFFYSGTGSISGKVMYKPDDSDAEKAKDTPCEGATVTAYLYHNKQFVEQKKVKTNSNGEFNLEGIRCGAYVLVITDSEGNSKKVSIVVDNKDNDGGTVYLEKRKIISQPVGEVVEYNDALYYWKERVFDDSYHETKLVCYKDGKEKVLFDTKSIPDEWDIGFYGDGKIAIANDRIFFIVCDIDGGAIYSCDLNGKNAKKLGVGDSLLGLSL